MEDTSCLLMYLCITVTGAALGYGMYHMAGGGGVMGQELPFGYHVGPQMPEHSVEVMGVDVI